MPKKQALLIYLVIVFLNAFVDLGHKILIQNTIFKIYEGQTQIVLTAAVNALILVPFVVLFSPSGYLADKYPKNRVIRKSALVAIGLVGLITVFYYLGWFWLAFSMTFLLAVQSAVYSPAKYGYIKELVGKQHLASVNGYVQAITITAILTGVLVYSIPFENLLEGVESFTRSNVLKHIAPLGWSLLAVTVVEALLAYQLPQKQPVDPELAFNCRDYICGRYLRGNLKTLFDREQVFLPVLGLAVFWGISQVVLAAFPAFAKDALAITNAAVVQGLMACAGIGIIIGSVIAGKSSQRHIETGLIPVGALGVVGTLSLLPGLHDPLWQALNFTVWGIFGGLLVIPLNALIQFYAHSHDSGRILAGNNFIQNVAMLGFLTASAVLVTVGAGSTGLFASLTIIALISALYTLWKLPQSLIRIAVTCLIQRRYRVDVLGFEHFPESGGVLMLGNHISWIDWALLQIVSPRPIRFVMIRSIYEKWYLKWLFDRFGVIPISDRGAKSALSQVTERLNRGEVVCLFPEGTISRTGHLNTFQRGFEKALEGTDAVVLPFYLHGLWGSRFSRSSDKLKRQRKVNGKYDVTVVFGEPLPRTVQAEVVKQRILAFSTDAWEIYTEKLPPLHVAWMETAKRALSEIGVVDSTGKRLTSSRLLTSVLCVSRRLRKSLSGRMIGLLLPTSAAGIIANLAALMAGKTPVNLNYTAGKKALKEAFEQAGIERVITARSFLKRLDKKGFSSEELFQDLEISYLEDIFARIGTFQWLTTFLQVRAFPAWVLKRLHAAPVSIDSPATVLFSSGSEGKPKGIVLSHRNLMANLKQTSDVLNTEHGDVVMNALPLFHAFGLTVTTFMPLVEGMPVVCHPDPSDTARIAKLIAEHRATIFCTTPTFLGFFARNPRIHPLLLESLRIVVSGAEKLNPDTEQAFRLKFNRPVLEGYGATETSPVAAVNIPDRLDAASWKAQKGAKSGTVGLPLPGTSLQIVDPVTLKACSIGEGGLVLIAGPQVMQGYLNQPEKTHEALIEIDGRRWYRTGDKGHLDEDGFLTIEDRYARFAKIGGEMVSLGAVEQAIRSVLHDPETELVAVNRPDPKKGERVVLAVTRPVSFDALRTGLLESKCNPLMIPSEVITLAAIPKLGSGKTDFGAVRKWVESSCRDHAHFSCNFDELDVLGLPPRCHSPRRSFDTARCHKPCLEFVASYPPPN
ncbi:MAG: acyl-[ACP]--phospholipid O-acyltransferase [Methylohalobius crimeensis]